jgi:hypothetical protein
MTEFWDAGLVLVILLGSSALGLFVRPLLSERHRSREVIEFVQLVVAMVMTFAALVLGLLTSSVKSSFDKVGNDLRTVAGRADTARSIASRMGHRNPAGARIAAYLHCGGHHHDLDRGAETSGRLLSH